MSRRLHYVDWLRVLAVLLLFPFHTSRVFNALEAFYVKSPYQSQTLNWILGFIDGWHMPLLFMLAGASTYFALGKRTERQYVGERMKRLLVPLVFGLIVLIPPQTWLGARFNASYTGSLWEYYATGQPLVWNVQGGGDYFGGLGTGQLWFILFLLVLSLVALPFFRWARGERGRPRMERFARRLAKPAWWLLPAFLLFIAEGLPDIADKNPFLYLAYFVLGFAIMFDDAFLDAAERLRWPALVVGSALAIGWMAIGDFRDSLPDPSVQLVLINWAGMLAAWSILTALLGIGKRYLDRTSSTLAYLAEASYPLYIIHQTVIVIAAWYVVKLPGPWPVQWLALLAVAVGATFALYEVVRRVGPLRFLFGMRPKKPQGTVHAEVEPSPQPETAR